MQPSHQFVCPACGYTADVVGGPSAGLTRRTVTMACAECKCLLDVVVGAPAPGAGELRAPSCPGASGVSHTTSLWEHPGPCPGCGAEMQRRPATTLWDPI